MLSGVLYLPVPCNSRGVMCEYRWPYSASLSLTPLVSCLRTEGEHSKEVVKPYDWTYTTDYKGTLLGESLKLKVKLVFCVYEPSNVLDSLGIRTL